MDGKRLLHSLRLENFLSYGPEGVGLELEPLNILIGQNASGKSNLIQAVELLHAAPTNLTRFIAQGGGIEEYTYKGPQRMGMVSLSAEVSVPNFRTTYRHDIKFLSVGPRLQILDEVIEATESFSWSDAPLVLWSDVPPLQVQYSYQNGNPVIASRRQFVDGEEWQERKISNIKPDLSILSQRNDPDSFPVLSSLTQQYQAIKVYRNFNLDGPTSLRAGQRPDLPSDFLEEDGRNLSLVLNDLQYRGSLDTIVEKLRAVYEDVESINVRVAGGTVQTFLRERGLSSPIPAARLSDGTLRYLCLLTILYHPTPPPLICLEEPEIGLHPDLISGLAEMLKEASQRTQIIVTTHSDLLVSKFSDTPEAVVVCERTPTGTTLKRLEAAALETWLEEYSLGEVWMRGGIGGTRW